jgi:uncharacterized protein
MRITRVEEADPQIVAYAALLHDVKRRDEDSSRGAICHAERGAVFARDFLLSKGLMPRRKVEHIAECIRTHRYRTKHSPATIEAKVLFDADKLDSLGAIGVARAFHFAGHINAQVHSHLDEIIASEAYGENDTAYREFLVKLEHLHRRLYTHEAKRLARERHRFMRDFFARLNEEVQGYR